MRVKAVIAYDGSEYQGFQKQKSTPQTITTQIEKALISLNINSTIVGSGRTDAGVHATGQVIHFDLPIFWSDLDKLRETINRKLTDIEFKHISQVDDDFHARFSAKKRVYRYIFKISKVSIWERKYISHYPEFDSILLQKALKIFEGVHDFKYFHKMGSITHTDIREIYSAKYIKRGDYHIIYFQANGFLRSQVRMMVDSALSCAKKEMRIEELIEQLKLKKQYTTKLAPPEGLYLARILY